MTDHEWRLTTTTESIAKKTDHEERLTTIDFHDDYHISPFWRCSVFEPFVILCSISLRNFWLMRTCSCTPFDIWVWVEISHCFARCEHTVRQVLCKKTCLYADFGTRDNKCVHWFEHSFAVVYPTWRVSTKLYRLYQLYQLNWLQHVTTCKFTLKRHVSAPFWHTRMCPCPTFNIWGHDWAETFHCCKHRIGPWDAFTVKIRPSTHQFDLYVQQISYRIMFFFN